MERIQDSVEKKGNKMDFEISEDVKFWLLMLGYTGGTLVLCYWMYKWFARMIGTAVVKELVKAGVIAVL